ncbi:MAG TPA: hypothetical protein VLZ31_07415 [Microbacteriaceae bacterium]|nr:hypothetical protein [Microbacteriaceae bacterium]
MAVDVLFSGGEVFTGSGEPVTGMSVGVTAGKITAIVPDSETASLVGPNTQKINLNGALLSPGFQDAHVHPTTAGVELLQCNLSKTETAEEAVER